jgi:hypothetical protein
MKSKKELQEIADKILKLETSISLGKNIESNQEKILNIMSSLSLEEMSFVDEIITKKIYNEKL